jgi:hypothetical protein
MRPAWNDLRDSCIARIERRRKTRDMPSFRFRARSTTTDDARRRHERRRRLRGDDVITGGPDPSRSVLGQLTRAYLDQAPRGR